MAEALAPGSQLPPFTLPAPDSEETQIYLGLKTREPFPLSAINAKLVVVEFLGATCSQCLANAPQVNRLYKVIQEDPALAKDVKLVGIAIGNSKAQADAFRKATKTAFPVFPDERLLVAAAVDISETPTMIVASENGKILAFHQGVIRDFDSLLKELRELHKTR